MPHDDNSPLTPGDELRAARERARLAKIEAHRLKAEHARLVAEVEDAAADRLTAKLEDPAASMAEAKPNPTAPRLVDRTPARPASPVSDERRLNHWNLTPEESLRVAPLATTRKARRKASPWMASFILHGALTILLGVLSFATYNLQPPTIIASSFDGPETLETELSSVDIDQVSFDDLSVESATAELPLEDSTLSSVELAELLSDAAPTVSTSISDLAPDVGTLLSGAGETASGAAPRGVGKPGEGQGGGATFFGAEARGDRFAFVVDNSGSMKFGRLETTLMELGRSVGALEEDQSFFVVFYSDQAYPMFYPKPATEMLPATRQNKQRLMQWLATVEMCMGGHLDEAIELVVPLNPSAVFVLSDGVMGRAGQPPVKSMSIMTEANDWPFVVHTLGMGVPNAFAASNLLSIAQAHRGAFTPVTVHPAAVQQSRVRPIRYNTSPGPVWGSRSGKW